MRLGMLMLLKNRIKAIPLLLRDKNVSFWKKALVVFGAVYLFLPVDLIPPVVPVFGALDDIILWVFIIVHLKDELDRYTIPQEGGNGASKYSGKDVLDVEYTVEDGKEREEQ